MFNFTLFPKKHQLIVCVILTLAFFLTHASSVQNNIETETLDFCFMCESSLNCFSNGIYLWIAKIPRDYPTSYENYISILPPLNKKSGCKIEISNHTGEVEDILVLKVDSTNGNGTNNIWSFTKTYQNLTKTNQFIQYQINRRTHEKGIISTLFRLGGISLPTIKILFLVNFHIINHFK